MLLPTHQGTTTSADGTVIAWQRFGAGAPLLFANGIGVDWRGLAGTVAALAARHTVVTWDYRGVFGSGAPRARGLGIEAHAEDGLAAARAAVGEVPLSLVGWSMGVQVAFAVALRCPEVVNALVAIGGVPWSPFRAAVPLPGVGRIAAGALSWAAPLGPLSPPALRRRVPPSWVYRGARAVGYIHPKTAREPFEEMARLALGHDGRVYLQTLAALDDYDGRAALRGLQAPVLFVAGERDLAIRLKAVRAASSYLPRSEVEIAAGCSHFPTLEDPARVHGQVLSFLERASGAR
ncbi:MAG: alpha/beta hydrolase [Deltaproteobacteria bacterium]|nr:alpha/beta hydrolase [Deltaproteobacteria bacterium]